MNNMIGRKVEEIVTNNDFYSTPVDLVVENIESYSKNVILNGGRGIGKSTVLYSLRNKNIYTSTPSILLEFDGCGIFCGNVDEYFTEEIYTYYYELEVANKILDFIKRFYGKIYEEHFLSTHTEVKQLTKELNQYIRNIIYEKIKINKILSFGELTETIIEKLRRKLNLESLTLLIDRFDSINNSREISQRKLKEYFKLFDRTILVSDDARTSEKERVKDLKKKGFTIGTFNYSSELETIKEILRRIIIAYNNYYGKYNKSFPFNELNDDLLKEIINLSKGNITLILESLNKVNDIMTFKKNDFDLPNTLMSIIKENVRIEKEIEKMYPKKTLHL